MVLVDRRVYFGKAQINRDLIKLAAVPSSDYILLFFGIVLGIGGAYLINMYEPLLGIVRFLGIVVSISMSVISLLLMLCTIARSFYLKGLAESGEYHIVQDELIHDDIHHRTRKKRWIDYGTVCQRYVKSYLTFKCFGVYFVSQGEYYSWSERYKTHTEGLRATSVPGDCFYIVTDDGKTPLLVYNTKFFEYKDE